MFLRDHFKANTAFEPDALAAMSKAFEQACIALRVYAGDEQGREIIAGRIIDLARSGVTDADTLSHRVVAEGRLSL